VLLFCFVIGFWFLFSVCYVIFRELIYQAAVAGLPITIDMATYALFWIMSVVYVAKFAYPIMRDRSTIIHAIERELDNLWRMLRDATKVIKHEDE
jgi:hypothetical protein